MTIKPLTESCLPGKLSDGKRSSSSVLKFSNDLGQPRSTASQGTLHIGKIHTTNESFHLWDKARYTLKARAA